MIDSSFILKEGYKPISILVLLSIALGAIVSDFLGWIFFIMALITIYAYRNPKRHIFENTQSVLSPIDGKIESIDKQNGKIKIYCKINILNTHIVRAPFEGSIKTKKLQHGLNLDPNSFKGQLLNEQINLKFTSFDEDINLKLKLVSGLCNSKIDYIEPKDVSQGEDIVTFVDGLAIITIKENHDILVNRGDKLIAGQTILFKR